MKVAELIQKRQASWHQLEELCKEFSSRKKIHDPKRILQFASLYRSACADLAMAEAYSLPPSTVDYLHRLVARAHNQLYRSKSFQWKTWLDRVFIDTPQLIFNDHCVHIAFGVFWGLFIIAGYLSYQDTLWPGFAEQVAGAETLERYREMYAGFGERSWSDNAEMTGFYIINNASIGLSCFVMMLLIIPGHITLSFNAIHLGTVFGYMFRLEMGVAGANFKNFVTAHGPFELTAIVLSAGAGLKIGLGWLITDGLSRKDSLVVAAGKALPIAMCAVCLFCLAAVIEGFVSPTTEVYLPWWFKGLVAATCSCLLMIYFVVLGYPRQTAEKVEVPGEL